MVLSSTYIDDEFIGSGFSDQGDINLGKGLRWYYGLEAAGGTREDVGPNSLNLLETGTVGQGVGVIGNAASFPGVAGNKLSHAFDSVYDFSATDFTFTGWLKLNSKATIQAPQYIGTGGSGASAQHIEIRYNQSTDTIRCEISDGTTINAVEDGIGGTGIPAGQFVFFAVTWNTTTKDLRLRLNDQAFVAANFPLFSIQSAGTQTFTLGSTQSNANPLDGLDDEIGGWGRVLNNAEITFLYNSGAGNRPAFIVTHLGQPVTHLGEQVVHNP